MSRLLLFVLALSFAACQSEPDAPEVSESPVETAGPVTAPADAPAAPSAEKLNLNTATEAEFEALVGERMAHEFDEYRPYTSIQDFRREIGKYVDADEVASYEEMVFVPIVPNESDEETLMQLPGIDATSAASLVALRPFADEADFLAAVAEATGSSPVAASRYLAE
ncbi:hypothetical protein B1759_02050 [Rubrivirga sp. SAORIC476]|uniref:hypothetical protein n=1 Tax=Rubrivirga sp. SAORIC476 TaxID=1961794 RepID=UPI000BA94544|nr:hypothetical protein [Rubrivirga sp. SAORIC476]MAQ92104.1 hypothetical protein [Rhodothermaceae bacterium]MBC13498.1 hypothetical protein [Rhodothermaceae bacterium]PAP80203.1 hypothetical protein B1759_02050 [Rubrivirga sp. SAORIC476]|tara:strand:- start:26 stop:526 length:501 start_codon:yes stop_codon:yes gene_type:complete